MSDGYKIYIDADFIPAQAENANTLGGKSAEEFASAADIEELQTQINSKWNYVKASCKDYADLDSVLQALDAGTVYKTIIDLTITSGGELNTDLTSKNGKDTYGNFIGIPYLHTKLAGTYYGVKLICLADNTLWDYVDHSYDTILTKLSNDITHSWDGTTLTVTSASGTSSADLKGDKGDTGAQGPQGEQGEKGADGKDGQDGKTPVVGVDYFTEEDKTQIVQSVIDSLGATPVFGYVDEDNNVIVRGLLSDGTYSIKYELEDGTIVEIGELTLSSDEPDTPVYTNQIPLSTEADGTLYNNGQGFKTGYRISGSSGGESAQSGTEVTGFIPVKYGDTVYLKGIVDDGTHIIALYGSSHEKIVALTSSQIPVTLDGSVSSFTIPTAAITNASSNTNYAFIRVSATEITAESIITVNEPIE